MFKITSTELIKVTKTLEKAAFAINTLERNGKNEILFTETKKDIHDLIDSLKSRYDLPNFEQWTK